MNNDIKRDYDEYVKMENSLEPNQGMPNNIKLLLNKKPSNENFIKSNIGSNLNLDYIPQELFMNFKNKKIDENENEQINKLSLEQNNMKLSAGSGENENQNLKSKNVLESNHFNSLYFNDKSNELKTSKINNTNTNTNTNNNFDFKISKNDFNLSESYINNNDKNNNINNIFNNQNNINNNLITNISKDTNSNVNRRYNEEISYYNSFDLNNNLNSNYISNNINLNNNNINNNINNNLIFSKSSLLSNNNSTCNGYSDHYINSILNISNTLTNNSNNYAVGINNNFEGNIKLRDIENKEKMLIDMENQRNKKINEILGKKKKNMKKN